MSQASQMLVGVLLGAVACELLGAYSLSHFSWLDTSVWMFRMSVRIWIYGLPFLCLGLGASPAIRSVGGSRAVALLALALIGTAGAVTGSDWAATRAPVIAPTLGSLVPSAHRLDLWQPEFLARLPSIALLTALATLYLSLGFLVFRRRDA
jgi:hypothetical protein